MILAIGELLADMIGNTENGSLNFNAFPGGAPFNLAVNSKRQGANVSFISRVGNDVIGRFLIEQTKKANFDNADIQIDNERNTTLAFVSLVDGERDFSFYRHDTADFNIEFEKIDFSKYNSLSIIHLGSLMLSEKKGVKFAKKVVKKAKALGVKLSFDVNFRSDVYKSEQVAKTAYLPFIKIADIVKFSEDEIELFTSEKDVLKASQKLAKKDQLILVTLGSKGSFYYYNGNHGIVPTIPVKPVDTTGAGDAFFGAFLANIENKPFTKQELETALAKANEAGAQTTQFLGAVKL
ncbi:MAG: carbohydrate kinase [Clostridia bacterium]|nr:carbohydrate kinase [Clostridia bacterium]